MRSAFVAGATGFVGANLVRVLLDAGVATSGLVRRTSPNRDRVKGLEGFRPIFVDGYETAELERTIATIDVDVAYSVLGSGASHAEDSWPVLLDRNVRVAADVARFAVRRARRLIQVGTCFEYAPRSAPLLESDPIGPSTAYAATKVAAQLLVAHFCEAAGVEHVHARLFGVYGPFEGKDRLVPSLLRRLRAGEPIALTSGAQIRDFTFVVDVAEALRALGAVGLSTRSEVFNVCTGRGVSVREVAETAADVVGAPRELLRFGTRPDRPDEPRSIIGDPRKLAGATTWSAAVDLVRGIERTAGARVD